MLTLFNSQLEEEDRLTELFDKRLFRASLCIQEVVASTECVAKCEDLETDCFTLLFTAPYVEGRRGITFPLKIL
jgi:hypothetical protein